MKATISGLVLEVHTKAGTKEGVQFNNLMVYEFGKVYPQLSRISLKPEQVNYCKTLVGKMVDVDVDVSEYQGRTSLYFQQAAVIDKKAAA